MVGVSGLFVGSGKLLEFGAELLASTALAFAAVEFGAGLPQAATKVEIANVVIKNIDLNRIIYFTVCLRQIKVRKYKQSLE
ncbi:MAG: hypothetical protein ACRD43_03055, partial [Pyrinomonadaceae bacterium]